MNINTYSYAYVHIHIYIYILVQQKVLNLQYLKVKLDVSLQLFIKCHVVLLTHYVFSFRLVKMDTK